MGERILREVLTDALAVKEMSEKLRNASNDMGKNFGRSGNDGYTIINNCIIPSSARDAEWRYRDLSDKFYDLKESLGEWKDDVLNIARSLSVDEISSAIQKGADFTVNKGDDVVSMIKDEYTRE